VTWHRLGAQWWPKGGFDIFVYLVLARVSLIEAA
jgi:hypothetical protein